MPLYDSKHCECYMNSLSFTHGNSTNPWGSPPSGPLKVNSWLKSKRTTWHGAKTLVNVDKLPTSTGAFPPDFSYQQYHLKFDVFFFVEQEKTLSDTTVLCFFHLLPGMCIFTVGFLHQLCCLKKEGMSNCIKSRF